MNSSRPFFLLLIALLVFCIGLAANLQPKFQTLENRRHQASNFFNLLLGDSSRIFANSVFVKADAYFHSGYYPTIFDNTKIFQTPHLAADTGAVASRNEGDEAVGFMGPPRDWIDAFGRHFMPSRHTELDSGGPTGSGDPAEMREILPWLKLSAELDPENIQTYIVTAFWLRTRMGKVAEGEQVLREGLRYNPNNPQLLYELGRVYFENYHDLQRARNIWEAALRSWKEQMAGKPDSEKFSFDNKFLLEQLQTHLALLEEAAGHFGAAIAHLEQAKAVSPDPGGLQKQIDELKNKPGVPTNVPAATSR